MVERYVRDVEAAGSNPVTSTNANSPAQSKLINISKRIGQGLFLSNTETELFSKPFAGKQLRFVLSAPGMVRGQKGIKHIQ